MRNDNVACENWLLIPLASSGDGLVGFYSNWCLPSVKFTNAFRMKALEGLGNGTT